MFVYSFFLLLLVCIWKVRHSCILQLGLVIAYPGGIIPRHNLFVQVCLSCFFFLQYTDIGPWCVGTQLKYLCINYNNTGINFNHNINSGSRKTKSWFYVSIECIWTLCMCVCVYIYIYIYIYREQSITANWLYCYSSIYLSCFRHLQQSKYFWGNYSKFCYNSVALTIIRKYL